MPNWFCDNLKAEVLFAICYVILVLGMYYGPSFVLDCTKAYTVFTCYTWYVFNAAKAEAG